MPCQMGNAPRRTDPRYNCANLCKSVQTLAHQGRGGSNCKLPCSSIWVKSSTKFSVKRPLPSTVQSFWRLGNALKEFCGEEWGRLLMINPFIIFDGFIVTKSIVNARGRILYRNFLWIGNFKLWGIGIQFFLVCWWTSWIKSVKAICANPNNTKKYSRH